MEANQTTTLRTAWSQHRLTTTVVISLLAHLLAWGAVIWTGVLDPAVILAEKPEKKKQLSLEFIKPRPKPKPPVITPPEPPLPPKKKDLPEIFVQVEPNQESAKKPEDTDKYSNKNSLAANPEPEEKSQPKIKGTQNETPRARDIPQPSKAKPTPRPAPESARKPVKLATPKTKPATRQAAKPTYTKPDKPRATAPKPGPRPAKKQAPSIQLAKPTPPLAPLIPSRPAPILPESSRPNPKAESSLERAKRRLANAQRPSPQLLPGAARKQKGGVPRKGAPTFNVVLTGYGDYDNKLITAIYNSWVRKNHEARMHEPYRVVVEFTLLGTGRIEGLRITRPSATATQSIPEFICQRSIEEPAPFEPWDDKMKRALGNRRPCLITFSFNIRD